MRRTFSILSILAALAIVMTSCAPPSAEVVVEETVFVGEEAGQVVATSLPVEEMITLDINWGAEPPTLDPSLSSDIVSSSIIEELFLGLTDRDPETQEAVPQLAIEWSHSDDHIVWTFLLRDDVPWVRYDAESEGFEEVLDEEGQVRIVDAYDVVYGVKRTCDPRTGSAYAFILFVIAGCNELNITNSDDDNLDVSYENMGVRALDDFSVEFTLSYGASYFPQILGLSNAKPMPRWIIEEKGDDWIEPGFIQFNGPYGLTEWIHGDRLDLQRNPFWYGWEELGEKVGNIDRVRGIVIEEASTSFAMYETNEIDTAFVPLTDLERVNSDPALSREAVNHLLNCSLFLGFITQKAPTDDARVRRALSMSIDRDTLTETVTQGGEIPANTLTNPLNFGSHAGDPDIAPWSLPEEVGGWGYEAAVEEAQKLMEEASYPGGAGLEITIMVNEFEPWFRLGQAIQAMWMSAFPRMQVNNETQEFRVFLTTISFSGPLEDKPNVYGGGWCADYPHANNWIYELFNPTEGLNGPMLSFEDPRIGELIQQFDETTRSAQTADPTEQLSLYKEAEKLLVEEIAAIAPLFHLTEFSVAKPWLNRIWANPINLHIWSWEIDWEAKQEVRGN